MLHCALVKRQTYYAHNPVLLGGVGNGSIGMANFHFLNVIWWCIDTNHNTLIVAFEKDGDKREGLDSNVELLRRKLLPKIQQRHLEG